MNNTAPYFDELSKRLRESGVPADRAASMIDDLKGYLSESGTDPDDEFGPAAAFAEQLAKAPTESPSGPAASDERWRFNTDLFIEMDMLREFGDQGWEVVSCDWSGFDLRRSLESPQRWEYRREAVPPELAQPLVERLAEEGWELAATHRFWHYFKRPVAATTGPAAELDAPPPPPRRRMYFNRRLTTAFVVFAAGLPLVVLVLALAVSESGERLESIAGAFTGLGVVLLPFAILLYYRYRKAQRR
jgi:hypothetical protein